MYTLASFLIGILFGVGLVISNMINPTKVLNFLDVTGYWDPSLLLVMVSAVITTAIGIHFVKKRKKPLLGNKFHYPKKNTIDKETGLEQVRNMPTLDVQSMKVIRDILKENGCDCKAFEFSE